MTDGYQKAHAEDFGNLEIDREGKGQLRLLIPEMTLNGGKYNIIGTSCDHSRN